MFKRLALKIIYFYQKLPSLRGFLGWTNSGCRFKPTCSEYAYQAIEKYGIFTGSWLGLKRIIRCQPWSEGGWDPLK